MSNKMKDRKKLMIAGGIIALIVLVLSVIFVSSGSDQRKLNGLLDLGEKYLEELSYEDAILVFDEAIAIDPKCAQAYMGKAQAQYALGQYEEAVITLQKGIEQVDDSTELEAFLQQILDEMLESVVEEEEITEVEEGTDEVEERFNSPLLLNYTKIVRKVDTLEPDIQLEVLGGNKAEHYIWESSNPECVTVSETGLVTCLPVVGSATVSVSSSIGWLDYCNVQITDSAETEESEDSRMNMGDKGDRLTISLRGEDGQKEIEIIGEHQIGAYVYHSGDVSIPEYLDYKGQEMPVTAITTDAYNWCNTMKSISIPASVRIEDEYGGHSNPFYYCTELEKINVDESNTVLKSVDGVLYSKDGKELISYPAAKSGSTFTVPDEVERIWTGAFTGCRNLEEIVVGEGNIYYKSLDGVLMSKENRLLAYPVGRKATSYSVPEEITQIAEDAFYMSSLEEVTCKSVESINSGAFRQSKRLKRIEGGNATRYISMVGRELKNDCVVEIAGIDEMQNLEQLYMDFVDYDYVSDKEKTGNLQELGKLENLKSLTIQGIQDSSGFIWLENLSGLEKLEVWSDEIDEKFLDRCKKLSNLESLYVHKIKTLSDISWIEDLDALRYFNMTAESIEVKDFSKLFDLPNLEIVNITNYSESDGLEEWFETMQDENPDVHISYSEW